MASQKQAQSRASSERPRGKSLGPLRTLVPFLGPYRRTLLAALSALLIASGAMLALPIALRYLIELVRVYIRIENPTKDELSSWTLRFRLPMAITEMEGMDWERTGDNYKVKVI